LSDVQRSRPIRRDPRRGGGGFNRGFRREGPPGPAGIGGGKLRLDRLFAVGTETDDDLTSVAGHRDQLLGKLQERYGYGKDQAERELDPGVSDSQAQPAGTAGQPDEQDEQPEGDQSGPGVEPHPGQAVGGAGADQHRLLRLQRHPGTIPDEGEAGLAPATPGPSGMTDLRGGGPGRGGIAHP